MAYLKKNPEAQKELQACKNISNFVENAFQYDICTPAMYLHMKGY